MQKWQRKLIVLALAAILVASGAIGMIWAASILGDAQNTQAVQAGACASGAVAQNIAVSDAPPPTVTLPAGITKDEKIRQLMVIGFDVSTPREVILHLASEKIGGIYLTGGKGAAATKGFDKTFFDTLNTAAGIPLTIASDEEGGQIDNFNFSVAYPSAKAMGAMTPDQVQLIGASIGQQLTKLGITVALAPVADISASRGPPGDVISGYDRSFSTDPNIVAQSVVAIAKGLDANGITATIKHFPGLGFGETADGTGNDSDHKIVYSPDISLLKTRDLVPYATALPQLPNAIVMLSNENVTGTGFEAGQPASVSPAVVNLLRNDYHFGGVITTDDLNVPSVTQQTGGPAVSVPAALNAGVTMPLFGNIGKTAGAADVTLQAIVDAVSANVPDDVIDRALQQVIALKNRHVTVVDTVTPKLAPPSCCLPSAQSNAPIIAPDANDNNGTLAYRFFIAHGLSPARAAGIIGNLEYESGIGPLRREGTLLNDITTADYMVQSGKVSQRVGWGIAQFTPSAKLILNYLSRGMTTTEIGTLAVQLNYLWEALSTNEGSALAALQAAEDNPEAAAMAFLVGYERPQPQYRDPGSASAMSRKATARAFYEWGTKGTALPQNILKGIVSGPAASPGVATRVDTDPNAVPVVVAATTAPACVQQIAAAAITVPPASSGAGCTTGTVILPVPEGGKGLPTCAFSQADPTSTTYSWGKCGCLPTSTLIIRATLEDNGHLDPNEVQRGVQQFGGLYEVNHCSGVYTGALAYLKSLGYEITTINNHPGNSDGSHHATSDADLAAIADALGNGQLVLAHTSQSVDSQGARDADGKLIHFTDGHYLVIRAVDAAGNFYVANPGFRGDGNVAVSPGRLKEWLDAFWAVKKTKTA